MPLHIKEPYHSAYMRIVSIIRKVREFSPNDPITSKFYVRVAGSRVWLIVALENAIKAKDVSLIKRLEETLETTDCDIRIEYRGDQQLSAGQFKSAMTVFQDALYPGHTIEDDLTGYYTPVLKECPDKLFDVSFQDSNITPRSNFDVYINEKQNLVFNSDDHRESFERFINDNVIETFNVEQLITQNAYCYKANSNLASLLKSYQKPLAYGKKFSVETAGAIYNLLNNTLHSARMGEVRRIYGKLYVGRQINADLYRMLVRTKFEETTKNINKQILAQIAELAEQCAKLLEQMKIIRADFKSAEPDEAIKAWDVTLTNLEDAFLRVKDDNDIIALDKIIKDLSKLSDRANVISQKLDEERKARISALAEERVRVRFSRHETSGASTDPGTNKSVRKNKKAKAKKPVNKNEPDLTNAEFERALVAGVSAITNNQTETPDEKFSRIHFPDGVEKHSLYLHYQNHAEVVRGLAKDEYAQPCFSDLIQFWKGCEEFNDKQDDETGSKIAQFVFRALIRKGVLSQDELTKAAVQMKAYDGIQVEEEYRRYLPKPNDSSVRDAANNILHLTGEYCINPGSHKVHNDGDLRELFKIVSLEIADQHARLGDSSPAAFMRSLFIALTTIDSYFPEVLKEQLDILRSYLMLTLAECTVKQVVERVISKNPDNDDLIDKALLDSIGQYYLGKNPMRVNWDAGDSEKFYELAVESARFMSKATGNVTVHAFFKRMCLNSGKEMVLKYFAANATKYITDQASVDSRWVTEISNNLHTKQSHIVRENIIILLKCLRSSVSLDDLVESVHTLIPVETEMKLNRYQQAYVYLKYFIGSSCEALEQKDNIETVCKFLEASEKFGYETCDLYKVYVEASKADSVSVLEKYRQAHLAIEHEFDSRVAVRLHVNMVDSLLVDNKILSRIRLNRLADELNAACALHPQGLQGESPYLIDLTKIKNEFRIIKELFAKTFCKQKVSSLKLKSGTVKMFSGFQHAVNTRLQNDNIPPRVLAESLSGLLIELCQMADSRNNGEADGLYAKIVEVYILPMHQHKNPKFTVPDDANQRLYLHYYAKLLLEANPYDAKWTDASFEMFYTLLEAQLKCAFTLASTKFSLACDNRNGELAKTYKPWICQFEYLIKYIHGDEGRMELSKCYAKALSAKENQTGASSKAPVLRQVHQSGMASCPTPSKELESTKAVQNRI